MGRLEMNFSIPANYRRLEVGEIIEPTDRFWFKNKGPWTYFEDDRTVIESIGQPLTEEMFPVIRLVI